jgi:hypothetical protein
MAKTGETFHGISKKFGSLEIQLCESLRLRAFA